MVYWQHHVKYEVTETEIISKARQMVDWDTPTIKGALLDLWRAIGRKRKIVARIPTLETAIEYLEMMEVCSFEKNGRYPDRYTWERTIRGEVPYKW